MTAAETDRRPPPWGDRRLVVTVDGPLPHAWYFREDWAERVTASKRMGRTASDRGDYILGYQLTGGHEPHPTYAAAGEGLAWMPPRAGRTAR